MRRPVPKARRRDKGVALFLFLLVMVPVFIFGTGAAIDLSRVITNYNYNSNIAQLAANAGATARDTNTGALNASEATRRAATVCQQMGNNFCSIAINGSAITVNVPMQPFYLVSQAFGFPDGTIAASPAWDRLTASATAAVCNSLEITGPSDQFCVRPGPYYYGQ